MTEIFAIWWFEIKIKFLVHRELLLRLKSFTKFCVTDDRESTGPSIKYVSTFFFRYIRHPPPACEHFFIPIRQHFSLNFWPLPPKKVLTYFMDGPHGAW